MTSNQFENAIIQQGQPLRIVGETIVDNVCLRNNIIATGVIIENCIFEGGVFFDQLDLNCGVEFKNCVFMKIILINACTATNYDHQFNFNNSHLEFSNSTIESLSFSGINQIQRGIGIRENSSINYLQVKNVICSMGSFEIDNSTVNQQFDISEAIIQNDISIRGNSVINTMIRFENIEVGSFVFTGATFNKAIHIWAGKANNLTFYNGVFNDDLSVTGVPIANYLNIVGSDFKKSFVFKLWDETNQKQGKLTNIYISSGKFGEQFIINGNNYEIDDLAIDTSKQLDGALYFNSTNIKKTKISGDNYNSNIVFNHSNFNELIFDFFYNYSTLSIISSKSFGENSSLTIAHSNLGKTHLFNVFLDVFDKINIYNSVLTEIITANVKWFNDNRLNTEINISQSNLEQKKEIYRQLKYALEKQGNRIMSLHFKALEMRTYKQETFIKVEWYKRIFAVDRFVLWLGQTNDFGQNWFKPVIFAIGFSLFFHFLIIVGISNELSYSLNLSCQSIETTWNIYIDDFSSFPQLMNPTHLLSRIYPNNPNLSSNVHLLDYLLKLILAFFIFQTVSAFRKYVK